MRLKRTLIRSMAIKRTAIKQTALKRILIITMIISLTFSMVLALSGCGRSKEEMQSILDATNVTSYADSIPDTCKSPNGKYEVGVCIGSSPLKDKGYNQYSYNGAKIFASESGKTYKYYIPPNNATDNDYYDCLTAAVNNGAEYLVAVSTSFANVISRVAQEHPEVKILSIDGGSFPEKNVISIEFKEQEGGYLAGYATVKEGYTKLGFCGGGGGSSSAVNRYGRGFVQGAEDAAREMGITVEMNYSYQYGSTYSASPELQAMANAWYENGTEVIFACGGSMFDSIAAAAVANDSYVIGPDSDASSRSSSVLTSALKRVDVAAQYILEEVEAGNMDKYWGKVITLGIYYDAVGLPTETWRMKTYTIEEYEELKQRITDGEIVVDGDVNNNHSSENLILNLM